MRVSSGVLLLALLCIAMQTPSPPVAPWRAAVTADRPDASGRRHFRFDVGTRVSYAGTGELTDPRGQVWSGTLDGNAGSFTAIDEEKQMAARIHLADRSLDLVAADDGIRVVSVEHRDLPTLCGVGQPVKTASLSPALQMDPCEDANAAMLDAPAQSVTCATVPAAGNFAEITVMVVYTPAVEARYGRAGVLSMANTSIGETNTAFQASHVNAYFKLARRGCLFRRTTCVDKVGYSEAGRTFGTILDHLLLQGDGYLDGVRGLRDKCKADLTLLLIDSAADDYYGKSCVMSRLTTAYREYAMSVVLAASATAKFSFTHELAHMMGAGHEPSSGTSADRLCADASAGTFILGSERRTTLTYSNTGGRTLVFSGPDVLYQGVATGSKNENNARTLRISAPTVAAFR